MGVEDCTGTLIENRRLHFRMPFVAAQGAGDILWSASD
jgi:hypothetical protein